MRRKLLNDQNKGKALELRLESEGATYYVIIAGMTINMTTACANGFCESTGEDEYLQIENETYSCEPFENYSRAKEVYDAYRVRYLDAA